MTGCAPGTGGPDRRGVCRSTGRWIAAGVLAAVLAPRAEASYPVLTAVSPHAGAPGKTYPVTFTGKLDGVGRAVWCDDPALVFSLPDAKGQASVSIAPEARPGMHLVRFVNAEGASAPIRFTVGTLPVVEEKEPNDEREAVQKIAALPAWVLGQFDKAGDIDGYAVTLKKDVPLFVRLDAYTLTSTVDAHVQILDAGGATVVTASDGRNLDPDFVFVPPADGVYVVRVAGFAMPPSVDVGFTGGPGKVYQLTLSTGPLVTHVFPAAVPAQGKQTVELRGIGLKAGPIREEVSATPVPGAEDLGTVFPKGAAVPLDVVRARYPILTPAASAPGEPAVVAAPVVLGGQIAPGGRHAAFAVDMKKGQKLRARLWAKSIGLPVDVALSVHGPGGAQVTSVAGGADVFADPTVSWNASVEGRYTVTVGDLMQRRETGAEFVLEVAPPVPSFAVSLADGKPVRVEVGKTSKITAKVALLDGWKEPLVGRIHGLPAGVYAAESAVPEKGGDVEFVLYAAANAPVGSSAATISVWTKADPPEFVSASYSVRADLRRGHSQSDFATDLWVSVVAPGTPPPPAPPKK